MRQYKQGIFTPVNSSKYKGTFPIIFRSGLELSMMRWLDRNERVLQWGSESIVIPYISPKDGKMHKYFTDFVAILKTEKGDKKFIIEVKPDRQTRPPSLNMKKKNLLYAQVEWAVNECKWAAAKSWCEKNNFEFTILTEKNLK